jgi:hypothetical protein
MDQYSEDYMDDFELDEAEGPAAGFDDWDEADEGDDEFLRSLGGIVGGLLGGDELDDADDFDEGDEDGFDDGGVTSFEDAVADAMDAEDTDEFFRRLRNIASRVGRTVGRVARTVAPIASMIPIPQAQAVGRIAGALGRVLADGADEFEALDDLFELAEGEDAIDAAAPVIAGLSLRARMPQLRRAPRRVRRRMVRSVATAARAVARRRGPRAARAVVPAVVQTVARGVRARRIPPARAPQAIRRVAARVVQSPRLVRAAVRRVRPARPGTRCVNCRRHSFQLRRPIRITISGG